MNPASLDQKLSLQVRRLFSAPRERVFRAWIERDALQQWLGLGGRATTVTRLDAVVGGGFRFEANTADGARVVTTGTYLEIRFPEKLVFTWTSGITDAQETLVTIEFFEQGASTEVVLTHERFPNPAIMARHQNGWATLLERLATALSASPE